MLSECVEKIRGNNLKIREENMGIENFLEIYEKEVYDKEKRYDILEATFSLQSLKSEVRLKVFEKLKIMGKRLLIVEFDTAIWDMNIIPDAFQSISEYPFLKNLFANNQVFFISNRRYQIGIKEYLHCEKDTFEIVCQQFLMPLYFDCFVRDKKRTNYETKISDWKDELKKSGFTSVESTPVYDYWWGTAFLIDAK